MAANAILRGRWPRVLITLLPLAVALLHALGLVRLPLIDRLDAIIYDARLRATAPHTLDPRVVIIDIDDQSLERLGQWPWGRERLAALSRELLERQQVAALAYDVMFTESDRAAGALALQQLAEGALAHRQELMAELRRLAPTLDPDAAFAEALRGRPVALGYYFTQDARGLGRGQLPAPVLPPSAFPAGRDYATRWNGFGAPLPALAQVAPAAGFLNAALGAQLDGVLRASPLLARYDGDDAAPGFYESLGLATYRLASGAEGVAPRLAPDGARPPLEALVIGDGPQRRVVPVDQTSRMLVPYRGEGGPAGGSFRYIPVADLLDQRLPAAELKGRIALVGATAPGLQDLRSTPMGGSYPGVEVHANMVSALLDGRFLSVPDYAPGYGAVVLVLASLVLAFGLSVRSVPRAVLLGLAVLGALVGLNAWFFSRAGLVLPLAGALVTCGAAIVLNMGWGYFVEARARRGLARLFSTYVPPELVHRMQDDPRRYDMRAQSKVLTVMFCDMRGFTRLSGRLSPGEVQALLNEMFSRLTVVIAAHRGTIDKYMGDCVMAFWGAPVDMPDHAERAVRAALDMVGAIERFNIDLRAAGRPPIAVGIGLNTGLVSVGDMGSAVRRSYTVVGDAVNLASRLEGLGAHYGVSIVATDATAQSAPTFVWQPLDRVRVRGREGAPVGVLTPLASALAPDADRDAELAAWTQALAAYRAREWDACERLLAQLMEQGAQKVLYQRYIERLASLRLQPPGPDWDGAFRFEAK